MFSLKNKKQKRAVFALAVLFFSSGIFFSTSSIAQADAWGSVKEVVGGALGGALDSTLGLVIRGLLYSVFVVLGWFTSAAVTLFEWCINPDYISGPSGLLNKQSVYANWKFIRDFFNLFFILTLLYTAFTIVFQVAKNYKQTLLSIVLAAMFVNFSFPITRVIIDVTNVPMYYFVNQMMAKEEGKSAFGNFLGASKIQDTLIPKSYSVATGSTTQLLVAIVMLFMFMIALLVFSVLMVVRLVAIVMLLIFSSVGFAASVIPGMQEYGDRWWKSLWQYSLFGPTSMLMMLIATRFFEEIGKDGTRAQFVQMATNNAVPDSTGMIASIAMFSIPVIMMWFAIGIGMSSSIIGAGAVVGLGYAAIKGAGKLATRTPASYIGRKIDSRILAPRGLSPTAWKMAFTQRSEEQKHKDEQPIKLAAGKQQDKLNDLMSRASANWYKPWKIPGALMNGPHGADHTDHEFAQAESQAGEYSKEITDVSSQSDYVINEMRAGLATKNTAKVDGALRVLAKNNDLNDMLTGLDEASVTRYGLEKKDGKAVVSSENMMKALEGILKDSGENNTELLAKKLMVIGDHATSSGNYAFGGMTKFDQTLNGGRGGFRKAKIERDANGKTIINEQADWAAGKVKNLESQKRQTTIHPDSLFTRTADGFGDINGDVAKGIIGTFTSADVAQVDRSRDDLKQAIHDAYSGGEEKNPQFMAMYKENEMFKNYVDSVVRMKRGKKKDADDSSKPGSAWYKANAPGTTYSGPATEGTEEKKEKTAKEVAEEGKARRKAQGAKF